MSMRHLALAVTSVFALCITASMSTIGLAADAQSTTSTLPTAIEPIPDPVPGSSIDTTSISPTKAPQEQIISPTEAPRTAEIDPPPAPKPRPTLDFGTGYKMGSFVYQIGGHVEQYYKSGGMRSGDAPFPISELRYPINVPTARVAITFPLNTGNSLSLSRVSNAFMKDAAGPFEDSDWAVINPQNYTLDIYSKSRAEIDLVEYKIEYSKKFVFKHSQRKAQWSVGLDWHDYEFDIFDTVETYPSTGMPHSSHAGQSISYAYEMRSFYLAINTEFNPRASVKIQPGLKVSPYTRITDTDNHLLRSIVSHGTTTGFSVNFNIAAIIQITNQVSAYSSLEIQYLNSSGTEIQDHSLAADSLSSATIEERHESSQAHIAFGIKVAL